MSKHSNVGPSSAHRWLACPGSVALSLKAPPQKQSQHAARGTAAHHVLEECFGTDKDYWDFEDFEYEGGALNEEDIEAVEEAILWLEDESEGFTIYKEVALDLSIIDPSAFGTADVVLESHDKKILKVYDYKHGKQPVEVEENLQALYYALGAIAKLNPGMLELAGWGKVYEEVWIGIMQPRIDHPDGTCRKWRVPSELLEDFASRLKAGIDATKKPDAPLSAGSHCRWCPANAICPEQYGAVAKVAQTDFKAVASPMLPATEALTPKEIGKILTFEPVLSAWLKSVRAHAHQLLEEGEKVDGFKLVQKRANRAWTSEADVESALAGEDIDLYDYKIKSPAKIEKLLGKHGKHLIEDIIVKPDTGTTIAPEHDKRPAVNSATNFFQPITKGD